jgi:hypothetical protein
LAVLFGLVVGPAGAGVGAPGAALSWDAAGAVTDLARLPTEWREVAVAGEIPGHRGPLFLTITSDEPLDSLHLFLRWAAEEEDAAVAFHGWSPSGASAQPPGAFREGGVVAQSPHCLRPLEGWGSDAPILAQAGAQDAAGDWVYRLAGEWTLQCDPGTALRIAAAGITGWNGAGNAVRFGSSSASLGGGWRLQFGPLLTELQGRINKRFISSRLTLRGLDLDRAVGIWLRDSAGLDLYAVRVDRISDRRIDLEFGNTRFAEGRCDLFLQGPDGGLQRFAGAVLAAYLDEQLPGDTNRGMKPGRPD